MTLIFKKLIRVPARNKSDLLCCMSFSGDFSGLINCWVQIGESVFHVFAV